jgi:ribosomal protein S12 methylthiotransferase accessory factor
MTASAVDALRVRSPDQTWDVIAPMLPRFGITRVGDVTQLDILRVPVAVACRPLATTLSVSQGKGTTLRHAFVSAAMEAIELWHAEQPGIPALSSVAARELNLPYSIGDLDQVPGSLLTASTRLDWVTANGVTSGRPIPVPLGAVAFQNGDRWRPPGLRNSTNGLASGNTWTEAALHGLYEVVERDALYRALDRDVVGIDPGSVPGETCAELIDRIRSADASLGLSAVMNQFGVPVMAAQIWSRDFPVLATGSGAHASPEVAAIRAITEAAQSRLTGITGSRDDVPDVYRDVLTGDCDDPIDNSDTGHWDHVTSLYVYSSTTSHARQVETLGARIHEETGFEPMTVDLSSVSDFSVVRVIAPTLGFTGRRSEACHVR